MSESFRALAALDRRVDQARDVLQRSTDTDPGFARRVRDLVRLLDERDRILIAPRRGAASERSR